MKYSVNLEGVNALRLLTHKLAECTSSLNQASLSLSRQLESNPNGAGPHYDEILSLAEEINGIINKISDPVEYICEGLTDLADTYEDIICGTHFSGSGGFGTFGGSGLSSAMNGGSLSTMTAPAGNVSTGSGTTFEGMSTGVLPNGEHAVKGNNFDRFVSEYYGSGREEEVTRVEGSPAVETIDPASVEGLSFTDREMANPDIFWRMHGYPKENYLEIASHIPEVQQQLAQGKSLDEICSDPNLRTCAVLYFDPDQMVSAEKSGPYYTVSGGRHRVLAARILGIHMPIRIKSIRTYH